MFEIPGVAGTEVVDSGTGAGGGGTEGAGGEGGGEGTPGGGEGLGDVGGDGTEGDGTEGDPNLEGTEGDGSGDGEGTGEGDERTDDEVLKDLETDGRKVDAKTRTAIAKLAKIDPQAAKEVRETYFKNQAILKETGTKSMSEAIGKIRAVNQTLDALGGEEGITEMQGKVTAYEAEIEQFGEGSPDLIKQLYEGNPEGIIAGVANGLELLASKDSKQLDLALLPTLVARLERAGVYDTVSQITNFVKEGKGQEAYDLLAKMNQWLGQAKTMAQKTIEMKAAHDPEAEKNARDRAEIATEKTRIYETAVATDVNQMNNRATAPVVEGFFKEIGLSKEGRRNFINGLNSRVYATMENDKTFQRNAKAIKAKGDAKKTAAYVAAKFAELLPSHFRAYRNENYPNYKPGKPKPNNGAGAGAGGNGANGKGAPPPAKVVTGKIYERSQVDTESTPDVYLITGRAYLKGTQTLVKYNQER